MDEAARLGVVLPLLGVPATVPQEVRIDSLEPVISSIAPRILFQADQIQLTDELDTFPEKQTDHYYDLLCALHILYSIAVSRSGGIPKITNRSRTV